MAKLGLLSKEQLQAEQAAKVRSKQTRYDTTRLALVYGRQSTKNQPIKNKEAALMQRDDLVGYAIASYHWPEENVKLFVENDLDKFGNKLDKPRSASGRLDKEFRPGLLTVEQYIVEGKAGAVFVRDVSRLFRDEDMVNPPQFAKTCKQHHVVIITYDQEFDFNASARDDLREFLDEAQAAADYLKTHRRTMLRAKERKGMRGDYAGHSIPAGFMLDALRKDYVPNPYWCDTVAWLTRRFRELDADVAALRSEIGETAIFPELPEDIKKRIGGIHLLAVPGGYTIASRKALIALLINPVNIGHKTFKQRIVKWDAHPAIVDRADYAYALAHLGKVDLEGNAIERPGNAPRVRRFTQEGKRREGLLAGVRSDGRPVIISNQGYVYVFQQSGYAGYVIKNDHFAAKKPYSGSIALDTVDTVMSERLEEKLDMLMFDAEESGAMIETVKHSEVVGSSPKALAWKDELIGRVVEGRQEREASARAVLDYVASLRQQVRGSLGKIDETIADIEQKITFKQREYNVARQVMSDTDITEHFASLARLRTRLADLREKQAQAAQVDQDIETVKSRLTRAREEWATMTLEEKRSFIRLITHSITLDALSDRWMKLTIVWSPVLAGAASTEFALFYRVNGSGSNWSAEEDTLLREMYQHVKRSDIMQALPHRSWQATKSRANALHLNRNVGHPEAVNLLMRLSLNDAKLMEEYGISEEEIAQGCRVWWRVDLTSTIKSDTQSALGYHRY